MLVSILNLLIISNATTTKKEKSILYSRSVIQGLLFVSYVSYSSLYIESLENTLGLFGGFFNINLFSQSFNLFIFIIAASIMNLTSFYPRKVIEIYSTTNMYIKEKVIQNWNINNKLITNVKSNQYNVIEYALIVTFILSGAVLLMGTSDLISMFLSIELQSYGLYILCTLYKDSESATGSGLTYFLLGGLSSCFILFGSALLYVNSGLSSLDSLYIVNNISDLLDNVQDWYHPYYLHLSLIVLTVGFLFKISAAPFHFWSPDVYDGIPTIVTTFVATIAKISIFVFILKLVLQTGYNSENPDTEYGLAMENANWKTILIISSLMSLIIGSVLGLDQNRIKRLLAYSTISHVGFILLALSICKVESIQAYIFYIIQYTLSNINSFFILIAIGYTLYMYNYKTDINSKNTEKILKEGNEEKLVDLENSPIQLTNQMKGYFYINSFLSISLTITLFSFVGIPPLIGFFAKQMVLSAALDEGYVFMALLGIITSVIGAVYYLNIVKLIFFDKSDYVDNYLFDNKVSDSTQDLSVEYNVTLNGVLSTLISILTMLILLFIYIPGEWFRIVSLLSLTLFKS